MSQSQASQKRRCPTCGSRRFSRDRASGQITCEEGHLQAGIQETTVAEPRTGQRTITRKQRKERKRKKKEGSTVFVGRKARWLELQCCQLLLRKQIKILREVFGFPAELELISRELWACYVSTLDVEPAVFGNTGSSSDSDDGNASAANESFPKTPNIGPDSDADARSQLQAAFEMEDSSDESDGASSASAVKLGGAQEGSKKTKQIPLNPDPTKHVRMRFTLVVIYLAAMTLRLPLMVNDLLRWVEERRLPYLQAMDLLPHGMRRHLNGNIAQNIDAQIVPQVMKNLTDGERGPENLSDDMLAWINRFVKLYRGFDIRFPEINVSPLLWRCVRSFALSPLFYERTRTVLAVAKTNLSRTHETNKKKESVFSPASGLCPPEIYVVAAIVCCISLMWSATEVEERVPCDVFDPLSALFSRADLLNTIDKLGQLELQGSLQATWTTPVEQLDNEQIDQYLDFLQDTLPQTSKPVSEKQLVERIFPLPPLDRSTEASVNKRVNSFLSKVYDEATPPILPPQQEHPTRYIRAGQVFYDMPYKHLRRETAGALPEALVKFATRAAKLVGVEAEIILKIANYYETAVFREFK